MPEVIVSYSLLLSLNQPLSSIWDRNKKRVANSDISREIKIREIQYLRSQSQGKIFKINSSLDEGAIFIIERGDLTTTFVVSNNSCRIDVQKIQDTLEVLSRSRRGVVSTRWDGGLAHTTNVNCDHRMILDKDWT